MTPTYTLWLGDCLEEMDRIEDGSVDMVLADVPYGTTACAFDVRIPFEPLWKQYKRVIKKNGAIVLFGSQPFTSLLVISNFDWFRYEIIWEKNTASNIFNSTRQPVRYHENILIFYKEQPTYNRQMAQRKESAKGPVKSGITSNSEKSNHYRGIKLKIPKFYDIDLVNPKSVIYFLSVPNGGGNKLHPTQKPVALLSYLIKTYTNEGETVLDNTFGSCSTGEAALRTGRRFIGIERDAGYYEIGKARMERVASDLRGELTHLPMFAEVA